jgi:hypothetical protein
MEYPPVQPAHLQQIREMNELFIELVTRQSAESHFPALGARTRRRLSGCDPRQRAILIALPRALFQIEIAQQPLPSTRAAPQDAVRCFAITALSVAFHMVRDSRFAARVLFAGSAPALSLLTRSHLAQLMDYSALPGLITSPLLEADNRAGPLLAPRSRRSASAAQPSRVALGHALSMLPAGTAGQPVHSAALSSTN